MNKNLHLSLKDKKYLNLLKKKKNNQRMKSEKVNFD